MSIPLYVGNVGFRLRVAPKVRRDPELKLC
jgi:hypothetical protein